MPAEKENVYPPQNLNETLLSAGRALGSLQGLTPDGVKVPVAVLPRDYEAKILDVGECEEWMLRPLRKQGMFQFADVASFMRYFNEHKNEDSRVFADVDDNAITFKGTLNFHGNAPEFNDHECRVCLEPTLEWKRLTAMNRKQMTQGEFALFLEENADMFTAPSGADLLELIQNLEGKSHVNINSAIKLQNGAIKLSFTEDVELRNGVTTAQQGDMTVPTVLGLSVAPFEGVGRYDLVARLRYRISDRKITFWYEVVNIHLVVRAIADNLVQIITEKTGTEPFRV